MKSIEKATGGFTLTFTISDRYWEMARELGVDSPMAKMLDELVGMLVGILGGNFVSDLTTLMRTDEGFRAELFLAQQRGEMVFTLPRLHAALMTHLREIDEGSPTGGENRH